MYVSSQTYEKEASEIGDALNILVSSQKKQLELGVKKSTELFQIVKSYLLRWNILKGRIEKRYAEIETAMIKYDPANLGLSSKCVFVFESCDLLYLFV